MMGKKAIEAARVFVEETGISDSLSAEDFLVEREEMLRTMFPTCELMPGFHKTINKRLIVADYIRQFFISLFQFF